MVRISTEELQAVRLLCASFWNPIGIVMEFEPAAVNDPSPMPADEYDGYLIESLEMVRDGASVQVVVDYLTRVEREYIGLTQPSGDKLTFVRKLFEFLGRVPVD
jgi:hypothetical protein